jgi:hypothetical protein
MNTREKGLSRLSQPASAGMPTLIIETAQKGRQVRSNMDCLVSPKAIPQRVQCCEQRQIHALAIMPRKASHEVIDQVFGRAEGVIYFSNCRHGPAFLKLTG